MTEFQLKVDPHTTQETDSESAQRSLDRLASVMIELSQHQGLTPVVVTPSFITPEPVFFTRLASTLSTATNRAIRFDWFREVPRGIPSLSDLWAMRFSRRINRELECCQISPDRSDSGLNATLQITPMLARPGGKNRHFVVGWADAKQKLPTWAAAIHLFDASEKSSIQKHGQSEIIERSMAA